MIDKNSQQRIYFESNILRISKCIMFSGHLILSVNEKLSESKFQYSGKYIIQFDGYFYVHVSGKRQTCLEKKGNNYTSHGTMVHMIHVLFVFFAVFENLKASFS